MPYIRETIITTVDASGKVHIAPIGIIAEKDGWVIAPFRPSVTLDNLAAVPFAVANYTDDVAHFRRLPDRPQGLADRAGRGFPGAAAWAALAHSVLRSKASRMTACARAISAGWWRRRRMRPSPASTAPRRPCWNSPYSPAG